jgi:hypothetical protein
MLRSVVMDCQKCACRQCCSFSAARLGMNMGNSDAGEPQRRFFPLAMVGVGVEG